MKVGARTKESRVGLDGCVQVIVSIYIFLKILKLCFIVDDWNRVFVL